LVSKGPLSSFTRFGSLIPRGRGFGSAFFQYFEDMVREKGYDSIVYYADHPAAMSICLKRGYRQAYGVELDGITGERSRYYVLAKRL